jgi:hypothetical protein
MDNLVRLFDRIGLDTQFVLQVTKLRVRGLQIVVFHLKLVQEVPFQELQPRPLVSFLCKLPLEDTHLHGKVLSILLSLEGGEVSELV